MLITYLRTYLMAIRCAAYAVDFVICNAPDAFLKLKMHENLFSAGAPLPGTDGGVYDFPQTSSRLERREREFILHNYKYIITKQLLDNIGGGHPLLHTK